MRPSFSTTALFLCLGCAGGAPGPAPPSGGPIPAPAAPARVQLLVRGDDFGGTHASNAALPRAFAGGIMRSASLLVTGPWFLETSALARAHPEWAVGVHLALTSEWDRLRWAPILPVTDVPSLVAPDGYMYGGGYFHPDPGLSTAHMPHWAGHPPRPQEVERELRAQIRWAQRNGLRVDYLDCHMGMACAPDLLPIVRRLAEELCLPVPEQGLLGEREIAIPWDEFTVPAGRRAFERLLRSLDPGLWRLITHPAEDHPELRAIDSEWGPDVAAQRSAELALLTDPDVRALIVELGIELVSVRDVWDYTSCAPQR